MHSLVIFASGNGSNARAIIDYFKAGAVAQVALVVCNKPDAGVLSIARNEHIPYLLIDKTSIHQAMLIDQLQSYKPSLIVLAGFLWKIPDDILDNFPGKVINIHPALLPAHGGKGMYGHHVHNAVLQAKETKSGITVHYVNGAYDSGDIILQAHCRVKPDDTAGELAARVHLLEHYYYPRVIEYLLKEMDAAKREE